jgi:hypothetical protein
MRRIHISEIPHSSNVIGTVGVAAALGAGLIYVAASPGAPARVLPAKAETAATPESPVRPEAPARITSRRWTFEKGPHPELQVYSGKWEWDSRTKTMDTPTEVRIVIPVSLPAGAARMTAKVRVIDPKRMCHSGVLLFESRAINPITNFWTKNTSLSKTDLILEYYFFDPYVVEKIHDTIALITEYTHPHESNAFVLTLNNVTVSEIEFREIRLDEVPPFVRDVKTLVPQLEAGYPPEVQHR